jgi:hypothetical protein
MYFNCNLFKRALRLPIKELDAPEGHLARSVGTARGVLPPGKFCQSENNNVKSSIEQKIHGSLFLTDKLTRIIAK